MPGLGTLINCACILFGGILGMLFGRFIKPHIQDALTKVCGISVLFIGISGALEGMLQVSAERVCSVNGLLLVICLALGTLVGELINIEGAFERLGAWLKEKTGNSNDAGFINAFVSASLTVCIGAMAIVGALQDGLAGNYTTLATKGVLDLIIILVMTCALGKGCIFSAIPVAVLQGGVTLLSGLLRGVMNDAALSNLSMVGSVLIFCVGLNLIWGRKVRVANMLPAIVFAVVAAFLPL